MLTIDEIKQRATHAFRAESTSEIGRFLVMADDGIMRPWMVKSTTPIMIRLIGIAIDFADPLRCGTVFIDTEMTLYGIRSLMKRIPRSLVMRQTLAFSDDFTGERDWSVE
ncbi:MAG: hypothetical protein O3C40_30620 [Planctomycetota bacterium]|nr:hypothetical protein [Planctomycetota bacterium]